MSLSNNVPAGVKFDSTSWGQQAKMNTYTMPQIMNQQKSTTVQKGKPRGGWDDEDEPVVINQNKPTTSFPANKQNPTIKPHTNSQPSNNVPQQTGSKVEPNNKFEIKVCDGDFMNTYEYENRIIQEAIQPNGARLKQSDTILNGFTRACESLPADIVGSILFHNLDAPVVWATKAKTLYAIEALVKKLNKYNEFFKFNVIVLKSKKFSEEGSNALQLKKILDDLTDFIEGKPTVTLAKPTQQVVNHQPVSTQPQSQPTENNNITKQETKPLQQQPTKLNPFNIPSSNNNTSNQTTTKPSGLPGAFKNTTNTSIKSIPKSTSSLSSQDEGINNQVKSQNKPNSVSSTGPKQATVNSIMDSLAGLDFSDNANGPSPQNNNNNFNNLYNGYQGQPQYGMSNGPLGYPSGQDPNMGYPMPNPYYQYPQQQYNPGYNGAPYNPHMYPNQFQGQYPPQQYNYHPGYPMQQSFQGQMQYGGPNNNQFNNQQVDQSGENEELSIAGVVRNEEQERLKQEELIKKQKQQEIENKFDSLKFLIK